MSETFAENEDKLPEDDIQIPVEKRFKGNKTSIAASTQPQKNQTKSFIQQEISELNGSTAQFSKAQLTSDEKAEMLKVDSEKDAMYYAR